MKPKVGTLAFKVTQQSGTEAPFTGRFNQFDQLGTYHCTCCEQALFRSDTKFTAGCGWPSFFETASPDAVIEVEDRTHGMIRTEIRCSQCDAHLGHVFPDGPPPTGLRYCLNSVAMCFKTTDGRVLRDDDGA